MIYPVYLQRNWTDDAVVGIHESRSPSTEGIVFVECVLDFITYPGVIDHCSYVILFVEVVSEVYSSNVKAFVYVGEVSGMVQSDERQLVVVVASENVAAYVVVVGVKVIVADNCSRIKLRNEGESVFAEVAFDVETEITEI